MSVARALARAFAWRPGGAERPLAASERALLPAALVAGFDLGRVRIIDQYHSPVAALMRVTVVRGPRIYWAGAPPEAVSLAARAHLAHELTHVWQYLALRRTGAELLADRRYAYRLRKDRPFARYGHEQQAAIVEDYVRLCGGATTRWSRSPADRGDYERMFAQ